MKRKIVSRKEKIIFLLGLCLTSAVLLAGCIGTAATGGKASGNLTIVFMNDTHSHLYPWRNEANEREYGGAARWATIINGIREEAGEILFLHAGDMIAGSVDYLASPTKPDWERLPGYGYRGLMDTAVFGLLGLDALVPGNHESNYGLYWSQRFLSAAPFDVLAANISLKPKPASDSYEPPYYKPYAVYKKGNFTVGVIGVTTMDYILTPQILINTRIVETVSAQVEKLRKECDVVVVLSHLGVGSNYFDERLASNVPGIDVIVGGHSHTMLAEPRVVNGTIITQANEFGRFVGRLDMEYQNGVLRNYRYQLIPADFSVPEDPEIKAVLDRYLYPITLEHALSSDGEGDVSLETYIAGVIGKTFPCDAVLVNVLVEEGYPPVELPVGPVSAEDFFTALWPHRSSAPDKDFSPGQVMEIVSGMEPSPTRYSLLRRAAGLNTLIRVEVPGTVLDRIEALNRDRAGTWETGFVLERFGTRASGETWTLVMDLRSWIDLYDEGVLTDSYEYQNLGKEIIDILLDTGD